MTGLFAKPKTELEQLLEREIKCIEDRLPYLWKAFDDATNAANRMKKEIVEQDNRLEALKASLKAEHDRV